MKRFNAIIWFLQRISGILLLIFLGIHFWVLHFTGTGEYLYKDVAVRLTMPLWKGLYIVFLITVIYHAMTGIRMVVNDFNLPKAIQGLISIILVVGGIAIFGYGVDSLFSVSVQLP